MITGRNEVARLRLRLDATFARIDQISEDLEVQGDFAGYLCIMVSNFVERAIVALIVDFARRSASPAVVRYVEGRLNRFTNANVQKLFELAGAFEPDWRRALEEYVVDEREAAVNSVIAIRNQIAHGESAGISYARIKAYYEHVVEVVDYIANLCDP